MIDSPCINICKLDAAGLMCQGCYRLKDEIAMWPYVDDTQKSFIIAMTEVRRVADEANKYKFSDE